MNCKEFEEVLHDLDRPGTHGFDLDLREGALLHAEGCSHCAQLMTESESLDFSLHALAVRDDVLLAPAHVEAQLLNQFRLHRSTISSSRSHWRLAALATAAGVLLAAAVSFHHWSFSGTGSGAGLDAGSRGGSQSGINGTASNNTGSTVASNPRNGGAAESFSDAQNTGSEYASAFVPLPYADDPSTVEGGMIVRVSLSQPALASLGLPVTDLGAADQIPADLVLSEDGTPQAIRLVSQTGTSR
jgi:hypothetical protein